MIFIGIDPSINSTGICAISSKSECFSLVVPAITKPMSKYEESVKSSGIGFSYVEYDKYESNKDTHINEIHKSVNLMNAADAIMSSIESLCTKFKGKQKAYVVMEGISYGSTLKTKSVFDLAGFNYLIRDRLHKSKRIAGFAISPPSEIKKFATGSGNAVKGLVSLVFKSTHKWASNFQKI